MPNIKKSGSFKDKKRKEKNLWISLSAIVSIGFITFVVYNNEQHKHSLSIEHLQQSFVLEKINSVKSIDDMKNNDMYVEVNLTVNNKSNEPIKIHQNDFVLLHSKNDSRRWSKQENLDPNNLNPLITISPMSSQYVDLKFDGYGMGEPSDLKILSFSDTKYGDHDIQIKVPNYIFINQIHYILGQGITHANFDKIDSTYTVEMVNRLFGSNGVLSTESQENGYDLKMYDWQYSNNTVIVTVIFQNGFETGKDQIGLS